MPELLELFLPIPKTSELIHTSSSINCYMRCPKLYDYKYEQGYRSAAPIPAYLIGTAVHIGLEYFWRGNSFAESMLKVSEFMRSEDHFSTDAGKVERFRISAYIKGYYRRWAADLELYDVISCELQFYHSGRAGKLDVLVRRKSDGKLVIIEHKTAGPYSKADEQGSPYWSKLSMDTQLAFYINNVMELTGEIPSVIYDVVLKTRSTPLKSKARQKKNESELDFLKRKSEDCETLHQYHSRLTGIYVSEAKVRYFRQEIYITSDELNLKMQEINNLIEQIENNKTRIRNTSACNGYGSPCSFMGVCTGVEQLDDPKFLKKERAHEELQQQKEAQ